MDRSVGGVDIIGVEEIEDAIDYVVGVSPWLRACRDEPAAVERHYVDFGVAHVGIDISSLGVHFGEA